MASAAHTSNEQGYAKCERKPSSVTTRTHMQGIHASYNCCVMVLSKYITNVFKPVATYLVWLGQISILCACSNIIVKGDYPKHISRPYTISRACVPAVSYNFFVGSFSASKNWKLRMPNCPPIVFCERLTPSSINNWPVPGSRL